MWYQEARADLVLEEDSLAGQHLSLGIEWERPGGRRRRYVDWTLRRGLRTGHIDQGEDGTRAGTQPASIVLWDPKACPESVAEAHQLVELSCDEEASRDVLLERMKA